MRIAILGWYGTETIGDRAILAGLLFIFNKTFIDYEISLGSLYPFFTERTIDEDKSFYENIMKKKINIKIFDSTISSQLDSEIKSCDIIIMGGGPLMHIKQMNLIEYAFKKAKRLKKKTALLGCGVGPLFKSYFQRSLLKIVKYSDIIILRDNSSKEKLYSIADKYREKIHKDRVYVSLDPAVQCALDYMKNHDAEKRGSYIAVNLRKFPVSYAEKKIANLVDLALVSYIRNIAKNNLEKKIRLVPMHYFYVGDDDREFLNYIRFQSGINNIVVQNKNLSLIETMKVYQNAQFNIGMRFHSIVLQTVLHGNNYILDYTEPEEGKIAGFLKDVDHQGFYKKRYLSLQKDYSALIANSFKTYRNFISLDKSSMNKKLAIYGELLKQFC